MTLDPSIDLGVDVLDEGPDDVETAIINWLRPLLPDGQVANARLSEDPVPFIVVEYVDGNESEELSQVDDVVSVHCLYDKGIGNENRVPATQFASIVHRRMLLLARHLELITVGSRTMDIDYVKVFSRPQWVPYGDETILRKVGRYQVGRPYAKLS